MKEDEGINRSGEGPNQNSKSASEPNDCADEEIEEIEAPATEPAEFIESIESAPTAPATREQHAFPLALVIVLTFAVSIGVSFVYLFWFAPTLGNGLELFKTVSAVLSGPLGFVLGFYFRVTESSS